MNLPLHMLLDPQSTWTLRQGSVPSHLDHLHFFQISEESSKNGPNGFRVLELDLIQKSQIMYAGSFQAICCPEASPVPH
jgi:hypothetical protein